MDGAEHSVVRFLDNKPSPRKHREIKLNHNGVLRSVSLPGCFSAGIPAPNELLLDMPDTVKVFPTETGQYSDYTFEGAYSVAVVSSAFRNIIKLLEPIHHQIIEIDNSIDENNKPTLAPYYALNVERLTQPSVDLTSVDIEEKQFSKVKIYVVKMGTGRDPKLTLYANVIKHWHFWGSRLDELREELFCSDEFHELWLQRNLIGLRFHRCEVK